MNRIFKVIWSQTRQSYVVVSELVKRGGWCLLSSAQKLALGLAVTGILAALLRVKKAVIPLSRRHLNTRG